MSMQLMDIALGCEPPRPVDASTPSTTERHGATQSKNLSTLPVFGSSFSRSAELASLSAPSQHGRDRERWLLLHESARRGERKRRVIPPLALTFQRQPRPP